MKAKLARITLAALAITSAIAVHSTAALAELEPTTPVLKQQTAFAQRTTVTT